MSNNVYTMNQTQPLHWNSDRPSYAHDYKQPHSSRHVVSHTLHRRSKIAIVICYICTVMLEFTLLIGAIAASFSTVVDDKVHLVDYSGSYTVVQLQQKSIDEKVAELAASYHFNTSLLSTNINAAAISQYSQNTIEYWYGLLHGIGGQTKPVWDVASLAAIIEGDSSFINSWSATELASKAEEAADAIGNAITEAVFPLQPMPMTIGLLLVANQKYLHKAVVLAWVMLIVSVLLAAVIRIAQNNRPFQSFWFFGIASMSAFLILYEMTSLLQNQQLDAVFESYNAVLAFYFSSVLGLLESYLHAFCLGLFLVGAVLLFLFFGLRYQRLHSTHHELSIFF